jgi:hypothetical protein
LFGSIILASGQTKKPAELSVFTGSSIYQGDLSESVLGYTKNLTPHIGIGYTKSLSSYLQVGATVSYLKLKADETSYTEITYRPQRALQFNASMVELNLQVFLTPFGNSYANSTRKILPYIGIGFGLGFYNLKRDYSRMDRILFTDKTPAGFGIAIDSAATMPKLITTIPITLGAKYYVNPNLAVFAETVLKPTFTDYLDGFKYTANPNSRDNYYSINIGVRFSLGNNGINCPSRK